MAVTVANIGTASETTATGTISPSAPAGTGGLLVLAVVTSSTEDPPCNTPSNWNARATRTQANGNTLSFFDRYSDGGADDSPTVTAVSGTPTMAAGIIRLAGAHASDAYDATAAQTAADGTIDNSGDIPAFDVAEDGSLQIVGVCTGSAGNSVTWNSPLTNCIDLDGTSRGLYTATAPRNAGTIAADTFTTGGNTRKAIVTIVYKPAAVGGGHPAMRRFGLASFSRQRMRPVEIGREGVLIS